MIFICKYDFGQDMRLPIYSYQNRCDQEPERLLGDDAHTVFVNAYGDSGAMGEKLRSFLQYIRTGKPEETEDGFVRRLHEKVCRARSKEDWRVEYMTLAMRDAENIEKGRREGRQEGRREGRQEGKQEMAANLFKSNIPIEMIAMAAGTTTDMVKAWLQSAGLLQQV